MNIFVVDSDPVVSAQMLCDKHVVKMIVESAQMLSTVRRMLDGELTKQPSKSGKTMIKHWRLDDSEEKLLYKAVHMGHPCTIWTAESGENYDWHYQHFMGLCKEYTHRYGKIHSTELLLGDALRARPKNIPDVPMTEFAVAMKMFPECIVPGDPVLSYRNFYHQAKPFAAWSKNRPAPDWWQGYRAESIGLPHNEMRQY